MQVRVATRALQAHLSRRAWLQVCHHPFCAAAGALRRGRPKKSVSNVVVREAPNPVPRPSGEGSQPSLLRRKPEGPVFASWEEALNRWQEGRSGKAEPLDLHSTNAVLEMLRRQGRWGEAVTMLRALEADGSNPTSGVYAMVMDTLVEAQQFDAALELHSSMESRHVKPHAATVNGTLRALQAARKWKEIIDVFNKWDALEPPDAVAHVIASTACLNVRYDDRAQSLLDAALQMDPSAQTYSLALGGMAKARRHVKALALLERIKASEVQPDLRTYGAVLEACARAGDIDAAVKLLSELEATGLEPDETVWGSLLEACRRSGRMHQAEEYVQNMKKQGVALNDRMALDLIEGYKRISNWDEAVRVLNQAVHGRRSSGADDPENETLLRMYTAAIVACGKRRRWQAALSVFQRMLNAGVKPTVAPFTAVIMACAKAGQWSACLRIFERMPYEGATPDTAVCNIILAAAKWCPDADWEEALKIFRKMKTKFGCERDAKSHMIMLSVLARFGRYEEAFTVYSKAPKDTFDAVDVTKFCSVVLLAMSNASRGKEAIEFLANMDRHGPPPCRQCFARAILACGRSGMKEEAERLTQEMKARGFLGGGPSEMFEDSVSGGKWEEAAQFAKTLRLLSGIPSTTTYNIAIVAFATANDLYGAVRLLQDMGQRGMMPSLNNYETLMGTAMSFKQPYIGIYLFEEALLAAQARLVTLSNLLEGMTKDELVLHGPSLYGSTVAQGLISHTYKPRPPKNLLSEADAQLPASEDNERVIADFHSYPANVALVALMSILNDIASKHRDDAVSSVKEVVMVVGRGRHSDGRVAILRPSLLSALADGVLGVKLTATESPNNPGRLILPRAEVAKFVEAQVELGDYETTM